MPVDSVPSPAGWIRSPSLLPRYPRCGTGRPAPAGSEHMPLRRGWRNRRSLQAPVAFDPGDGFIDETLVVLLGHSAAEHGGADLQDDVAGVFPQIGHGGRAGAFDFLVGTATNGQTFLAGLFYRLLLLSLRLLRRLADDGQTLLLVLVTHFCSHH